MKLCGLISLILSVPLFAKNGEITKETLNKELAKFDPYYNALKKIVDESNKPEVIKDLKSKIYETEQSFRDIGRPELIIDPKNRAESIDLVNIKYYAQKIDPSLQSPEELIFLGTPFEKEYQNKIEEKEKAFMNSINRVGIQLNFYLFYLKSDLTYEISEIMDDLLNGKKKIKDLNEAELKLVASLVSKLIKNTEQGLPRITKEKDRIEVQTTLDKYKQLLTDLQ